MKYRRLGRTGLFVSEICLGTMTFGNQIDEAGSISLIEWALGQGVNFIDTADLYVDGRTEEIVGKALKKVRHQVVLTTKTGAWQSGPDVNDIGLAGKHDPKNPPAEGTRFSNKLQGKVYSDRYWLSSNFRAVASLKKVAQKNGHSMAQLSLAAILNNPAITSVICGANSVKQLEENVSAVEVTLVEEELNACDEVWHELSPPRFFYGSQQLYR